LSIFLPLARVKRARFVLGLGTRGVVVVDQAVDDAHDQLAAAALEAALVLGLASEVKVAKSRV
jgi:hypothetical protein